MHHSRSYCCHHDIHSLFYALIPFRHFFNNVFAVEYKARHYTISAVIAYVLPAVIVGTTVGIRSVV